MRKIVFLLLLSATCLSSFAGKIHGLVSSTQGAALPYASISIKGTTRGTTANNEGNYFLQLQPGTYTIICQYVGYKREEKQVVVKGDDQELNFILQVQELMLGEVVVKKGEDPAYEIIRQAIRKRAHYQEQPGNFQCEVYTKGQFRLRDYPKRLFGDNVDFGDGDTSKRKMLYLSETVSIYSVQQPNKAKVEVLSSKVSGQSDGFGLSAPQILSFYNNLIQISDVLNQRGFISPISDNALNYYRYKYEGAFFEDGRQVNRIQVIPKRKYEPLFSGYINIVEDEWRIHSLQLYLVKQSQMELLDSLRIEQLYIPYDRHIWVIKSQVLYPAVKMLGFDAHGSFVNIYSRFDIAPRFKKGFWDNTVLKYLDSSNKKTPDYWDNTRPVPLQTDEVHDYMIKDSLEQVRKNPAYLDSIDRLRNQVRVSGLILYGKTFTWGKKRSSFTLNPILGMINYNTVEGLVVNATGTYTRRLDTMGAGRRSIFLSPEIRYGFNNGHLNASLTAGYRFGKKYFNTISIAGGKTVLQFNNAGPVNPRANTIASLYYTRNYMKIYEAWFGRAMYSCGLGEGFTLNVAAEYQDRLPLENTTDYRWKKYNNRQFTANYPTELLTENFKRHQAFMASVAVSWQPGTRYVELPGRKINIGSRYPRFTLNYTQAFRDVFGSDVQYSKWSFAVSDDVRLKLAGQLSYRLGVGGFLHIDSVNVQDYTHFNGNKFLRAAPYLNSFQLASYYEYSNTERFYSIGHLEWHLNGFLTNKIPGFRALNWHLVAGANTFYVNKDRNYLEVFAGLENILKIFRVDFVQAWQSGKPGTYGIRVGIRGR